MQMPEVEELLEEMGRLTGLQSLRVCYMDQLRGAAGVYREADWAAVVGASFSQCAGGLECIGLLTGLLDLRVYCSPIRDMLASKEALTAMRRLLLLYNNVQQFEQQHQRQAASAACRVCRVGQHSDVRVLPRAAEQGGGDCGWSAYEAGGGVDSVAAGRASAGADC